MAKKVRENVSDFIEEFLLSQGEGRVKLEKIIKSWNSEENQELFRGIVLTSITPRAKTAYRLFMEANKEKGFQKARAHWLILSDEEKEPWLEKGKKEKEKHLSVVGKPIKTKKTPKAKTKEEKEVDKLVEKSFRSSSSSSQSPSSKSESDNPVLDFIAKERQNLAKKHPDWDMRKIVALIKTQWEKKK